jgi:SAM-dependent methyltransferase
VTHIDQGAVAAVGALYEELGVDGRVLDLMSSWVSHLRSRPAHLTVLGMNARELAANTQAHASVVHDLNADPTLPFDEAGFDDALCCVSIDYLVRPVEVFAEVARVVRPGGRFICTFSNRLFPTKAVRGWLQASEQGRVEIATSYFRRSGGWEEPVAELRTPRLHRGDPLYAVWARRLG